MIPDRSRLRSVLFTLLAVCVLAAPFYVLGILNNVALGLANRMMPTLPVFFVASSVLIFTGLLVFSIAAPSMMQGFFQVFRVWFETFEI